MHFISHAVQPFSKSLGAPEYAPEQYTADKGRLPVQGLVHVECLGDGAGEVAWVDALAEAGRCNVLAIVASCNLADGDAAAQLVQIKAASPRVRG
jgi:hypothetical protein